jgi:hypothetical protein
MKSMALNRKLALAWGLAVAPVFLFTPAKMLAGVGPCTFSHLPVIFLAPLFFMCLELAALRGS